MGKLNFCTTCGSLQLREAKDQIEKLLQKESFVPTRCGLCEVVISDRVTRGSKRKKTFKVKSAAEADDDSKKTVKKQAPKRKLSSVVADSDGTGTLDMSVDDDNEMIEVSIQDTRDDHTLPDGNATDSNNVEGEGDDMDNDDDFEPDVDDNDTNSESDSTKIAKVKDGFMDKTVLGAEALAVMCDTDGPDDIVKLKCKFCKKLFTSMFRLFAHAVSAHKVADIKEPYECSTCQARFRRIRDLRQHMEVNHKAVQTCPICNRTSLRRNFLKMHMKTHEQREPKPKLTCPELYCTVQCRTRKDLSRHLLIHTGEKPFTCETCGRGFTRKPDLLAHIRLHTGDYLYCTLCDTYRTCRMSSLNKHIKDQHTPKPDVKKPTEKKVICELCGGAYASNASLKKHRMATHTKERLYYCKQCPYVTSHSSNIPQHVKAVHQKLKPHKCGHCERSFALPRTRNMHERTHTGEKPYECEICGKRFKRRDGYVGHKKLHTAEYKHECDVCGYKTVNKQAIIRHKLKHHNGGFAFNCTKCNMAFANPQTLRVHNKGHKDGLEYIPKKRFQCKECDFSSDQQRCLKRHTDRCHGVESTYECGYCHKKFVTAESCERHVEKFHMKYFKPPPSKIEETTVTITATIPKEETASVETVPARDTRDITAEALSAVFVPLMVEGNSSDAAVVSTSSAATVLPTAVITAGEEEVAAAAAVLGMLPGGYPPGFGQVEEVITTTEEKVPISQ